MSSSDDDDCYGNIAQRLHSMKQTYKPVPLLVNNENNDNLNVEGLVDDEDCATSLSILLENESLKMELQAKDQAMSSEPRQPITLSKRVTRNSLRMNAKNSKQNNAVTSTPPENPQAPRQPASRTPARRRATVNGRRRGRGRSPRSVINNQLPVYSIGNTYEYPDASHDIQLFDRQMAPEPSIDMADEDLVNTSLDDNEEISVKVFWKSSEYVKFIIRKFQKLSQIFDFFSERERIKKEQLFFTLGDRVLRPDDTPDSIDYSICKFIEGGIVHYGVTHLQHLTHLYERPTEPSGIQLKFQCQQRKKPFITNVNTDQKLYLAMVKCAEDLEVLYSQVKFYFDGDLVDPSATPNQLELEGGECIDVRILS